MKRVKVDFSATVRGGMIRASQRRASELLAVGDRVEAFDPGEDMTFFGVVQDVDQDGRFAYLRMEWAPAGSTFGTFARVMPLFGGTWRAGLTTEGTHVDPESLTHSVRSSTALTIEVP